MDGSSSGYTADQIRAAEAPHLAAGEPLMRRAASGLARIVDGLVPAGAERRVVLLVGSGDNGGDALYAGADLAHDGWSVAVVRTGARVHEAGLEAVLAAGGSLQTADGSPWATAHIVLDGMLGIGVTGSTALRSPARDVVDAIAALPDGGRPIVVAVDVPSGLDADTGVAPDEHVLAADVTVTFGGVKAGLLRGDGPRLAGRVELVDVGIAEDLRNSPA
jgi:NAD(P)H-hydrate epimerase